MRGTLSGKDLAAAVAAISPVLSKKSGLADSGGARLGGGVRFRASGGVAEFHATDSEFFATARCPWSGEDAAAVVGGRKFLAACGALVDDEVVSLSVGSLLLVSGKSGKFQVSVIAGGEVPDASLDSSKFSLAIKSATLSEAMSGTVFAANGFGVMSGLLVEVAASGDRAVVVGLDGVRASRVNIPLSVRSNPTSVIVPSALAKVAAPLLRLSTDVVVEVFENSLSVTSPTGQVASRLIGGDFPNVAEVFSRAAEQCSRSVSLRAEDLARAIMNVLAMGDAVRSVVLEATEFGVLVSSQGMESSGACDVAGEWRGEASQESICVNGDYVVEWLRTVSPSPVRLSLSSASNPVILAVEVDGVSLRDYIVMPIRHV